MAELKELVVANPMASAQQAMALQISELKELLLAQTASQGSLSGQNTPGPNSRAGSPLLKSQVLSMECPSGGKQYMRL